MQAGFVPVKDDNEAFHETDREGRNGLHQISVPLKRERGECVIHPAVAPVSLLGAYSVCFDLRTGASGGQNLAALRTTAGQNLAAVGSSHSLTETVNLGTVTVAGLVGTLHLGYTSCICKISYARQLPLKGNRSNA